MYVRAAEAKDLVCHRTIGTDKTERNCKTTSCMAWEWLEFHLNSCPHCNKPITMLELDEETRLGYCKAKR